MVLSKILQERLLSCDENDGFVVTTKDLWADPSLQSRYFMVSLMDLGDGIESVLIERGSTGNLVLGGLLCKGLKIFFPDKDDVFDEVSLESGPMKLGKSLTAIKDQRVCELYDEIVSLVFDQDGVPDLDEIPFVPNWSIPTQTEKHLIMRAAGILYQHEGISFAEFLKKILKSPDVCVPQIRRLLSSVDIDKKLLIQAELSSGLEQARCLGQMRRQLCTCQSGFLISALYSLSHVKLTAEKKLKDVTDDGQAAIIKRLYDGATFQYPIHVTAIRKDGSVIKDSFFDYEDFLDRVSPLGILGSDAATIDGYACTASCSYKWNEIAWIKHGKAFMYKNKEV